MNLPFMTELVEGRYFNDGSTIKGKSAHDIAEIVFFLTLVLEILHNEDEKLIRTYAEKTLAYPDFLTMKASATDYHNLVAVLLNQDEYHEKIDVDRSIAIPKLQLKRYLTNLKYGYEKHSDDRAFFVTLENYLKMSEYKTLRRIVGDWQDASKNEKSLVISTIRRELNKHAYQSDLYNVFKQKLNL